MPVMPERASAHPSMVSRPVTGSMHRAGNHSGPVDLHAELRGRSWWGRRSTLDQDGADLVPHIVEPVAQHHADPMFAGRHIAERFGKAKPRVARHRNVPVLFAHVRTRASPAPLRPSPGRRDRR